MSYSKEKAYSESNKLNLAKEYSEGNTKLENLLLKLWNNKVSTISCHNTNNTDTWSLTIRVDRNSFYLIDEITKIVQENIYSDNKLEYRINYDKDGYTFFITSTIKNRDKTIDEISACIDIAKNKKSNEITNDLFYIANLMKTVAETYNLDISFIYIPQYLRKTEKDCIAFAYTDRVYERISNDFLGKTPRKLSQININFENQISMKDATEEIKKGKYIITPYCIGSIDDLKEYMHAGYPKIKRFRDIDTNKKRID